MPKIPPEQVEQEAAELTTQLQEILKLHLPTDMDVQKVAERGGLIVLTMGMSRTSVAAATVYAAIHSAVVGLDPEALKKVIDEVYAECRTKASIQASAEAYAEMNTKHHLKQMAEDQGDAGDLGWFPFIAPISGKVH